MADRYIAGDTVAVASFIGFESMIDNLFMYLTKDPASGTEGTAVDVVSPFGDKPLIDYWGLPAADAAELRVERVPLVGATAGLAFQVRLKRLNVGSETALTFRVRGHALTLADGSGRPLVKDAVPTGEKPVITITPKAIEGEPTAEGVISSLDVMQGAVMLGSLVVRSFAPLHVRVRVRPVVLKRTVQQTINLPNGQTLKSDFTSRDTVATFPDTKVVFETANAIWRQGGVIFDFTMDTRPHEVTTTHEVEWVDLDKVGNSYDTPDLLGIAAANAPGQINVYLARRHKDTSGWKGTLGYTYTPAASQRANTAMPRTAKDSNACIVFFAEDYTRADDEPDNVPKPKDLWDHLTPRTVFGHVLAHEIGHYLGLRHPHATTDDPAGFSSEMMVMYNWIPCGHLLLASDEAPIRSTSQRRDGVVGARRNILRSGLNTTPRSGA